jgi:TPR repeat protein
MSQEHPKTEITLNSNRALTRPVVGALVNRGLTDLEATENADQWLEIASEHFSRDCDKLMALHDSQKINYRTKRGRKPLETWLESTEHSTNMSAYIDCLRRAAAAKPDYAKPLMEIAKAYLSGWGVAKSRDEALRLLRVVSAVASPDNLCDMCFMIEYEVAGCDGPWAEGMGEIERWYRRAAEQGDETGQFHLAEMYAEGAGGLKQDYELAKYWYTKAAENGEFPPAEYFLKHFRKKRQKKAK